MAHIMSILVAGASIAAVATNPAYCKNVLLALVRTTGYGTPGGVWRIIAIILALANLKNLLFVWHVRPLLSLTVPHQRRQTAKRTLDTHFSSHDLPHLFPANANCTKCALQTRSNILADLAPRDGLQSAQIKFNLLLRHGRVAHPPLHSDIP